MSTLGLISNSSPVRLLYWIMNQNYAGISLVLWILNYFIKKLSQNGCLAWNKNIKSQKKKLKYYNLDDKIIHSFHFPGKVIDYPDYPAHLHIDILPRAQKKGIGLKMMNHFIKYLGKQNVKGLHLGVDIKNDSAIRFYKKYGLITLEEKIDSLVLGIRIWIGK